MATLTQAYNGKVYATLDDGRMYPVEQMFGGDGEPCEDFRDAVSCVAGPDENGMWIAIEIDPGYTVLH